ncbi:MAG: sigma-70 family RNA polymerase sigma factor [Bacteroidales bacterium]|nr:sigma-70 family RNA polymerase sigma factor [Bacteroidales bacterium]
MNELLDNKTDTELAMLYRKTGEGVYLGSLYKRYTKLVYVVCFKYLKDREVAEEAVQQIFEALIVSLRKYEVSNFKSWLTTVSRNHCIIMLKNNKNIVEYCDFFEKNVEEIVEFEDIFNQEDRQQKDKMIDKLSSAVEALPKEQKICIELFYLKGKSYAEITELTDYDFKKIKSYLQNGKRNLRNFLTKEAMLMILLFYSVMLNF